MFKICIIFFAAFLAFATAGKYGPGPAPLDSYDYVIVGSGNAGSVVAKRLTDDPRNFKVLVLEAGFPAQSDMGGTQFTAQRYTVDADGNYIPGRPLTVFDVPAFYLTTFNNGQALNERGHFPVSGDWGIGGNYLVSQGRLVGGSGTHNGNAWVRGDVGTLDYLWNVTGWKYADLLPYYKLSENCTYPGAFEYPQNHNFSGPIQVSTPAIRAPEANITFGACVAAGYGLMDDINSQTTGCSYAPVSVRRGVKDSPALRYLWANIEKPNLDVLYYAQATHVLFDKSGVKPRANAVRWRDLKHNRTHEVTATREVILAAGPLNTPKLLWFSGIGPVAELTKWGLPVMVQNENVGRNIRNGFSVPIIVNSPNTVAPNMNFLANQALEYAQHGTGWWAVGQPGSENFLKSDPSLPYADLSFTDRYVNPPLANLLHAFPAGPSSAKYADGVLYLNSSHPLDPPYLYQPIFTHEEDINTTIKAIQKVRQLLTYEPAKSFFGSEVQPGSHVTSYADLSAYIKSNATTFYHYTGSCKMGNTGDPKAVVDTNLRVLGVTHLRVVDTSINAGPLRGGNFPHATSVAVAEKAAALIQAAAAFAAADA